MSPPSSEPVSASGVSGYSSPGVSSLPSSSAGFSGPLVPRREVPAALPPEFVAATAFVSAVALGSVLVGSLVPYFYKLFNALIVHLLSDIYRKNSE